MKQKIKDFFTAGTAGDITSRMFGLAVVLAIILVPFFTAVLPLRGQPEYKVAWLIYSGVLLLVALLGWSIWTLRKRNAKLEDYDKT